MSCSKPLSWIPLALVLSIATPIGADIIVLTNGHEIQGEIVHEGDDTVVLRFPGGTMKIARRQVLEIRKQKRGVYLLEEGEKALRRGDFDRAIETLEEARKERPESEEIERALIRSQLDRARDFARHRRLSESLAAYEEILDEHPDDSEAANGAELVADESARAADELALGRRELASDVEAGLSRLTAVYETYPDLRDEVRRDLAAAHIRAGFGLGTQRDWERAANHLYDALILAPERADVAAEPFIACQLNRIAPLAEAGRFTEIEPIARRGLEVAPQDGRLEYWLAISLEAGSDATEARKVYLSLLDDSGLRDAPISELRSRVEQQIAPPASGSAALTERAAAEVLPGGFRELASKHFVIRHRNNAIAGEVRQVAERFYRDLFDRLECSTHWRNPCEIVIFPDQAAYLGDSELGNWSGAAHQLTLRRGLFSKHRITSYQDQPGLTTGVLQHEIAHALLTHKLNYPASIPLWIHEGFAVGEGPAYTKQHYARLVRAAIREDDWIPLAKLTGATEYPDSDRVSLFYAQSWGVVSFLMERGGSSRFIDFVKSLTEGRALPQALLEHYRIGGVLALENRWKATLER